MRTRERARNQIANKRVLCEHSHLITVNESSVNTHLFKYQHPVNTTSKNGSFEPNKPKPQQMTIWDQGNSNEAKTKHSGQELVNFDGFIYYLIDMWDKGCDLLEGSN
jgi:hypothetical protein